MASFLSNLAAIEKYCSQHTSPAPDPLEELERETYLKTLSPQMITGHIQGRFISLISKLIRPKCILEIGTFTAYGSLCLAEGLTESGVLHTIESDESYQHIAMDFVDRSSYQAQIIKHQGDALSIIPTIEGPFDLVYIDAAKTEYKNYYDLVFPKVRAGGIILADNLLWSGKVLDPKSDDEAISLRNFAREIASDKRVEQLLIPVRDGLLLCRKLE